MKVQDHAARQAASRGIPIEDVVSAAQERLDAAGIDPFRTEAAVKVGWAEDGWRGGSNGNVVWAIIRFGELVTTMFRREDQPSTPQALRVRTVLA